MVWLRNLPTWLWPELVFCVILMGASWGIRQIKRGTQSLLAGTAFHLIGNVFFWYQLIVEGAPAQARYLLLAGCLALWIGLLVKWLKPESEQVAAQ